MNKTSATRLMGLFIVLFLGFSLVEMTAETTPASSIDEKSFLELSAVPVTLSLNVSDPAPQADITTLKQINAFKEIIEEIKMKAKSNTTIRFSMENRGAFYKSLITAAKLETDPCFKNYLLNLANNIFSNSLFSCDIPNWMELEKNRAEIIFLPDNRMIGLFLVLNQLIGFRPAGYRDNMDTFVTPVIYLNRPDDTEIVAAYSDLFPKMQDYMPLSQGLATAYSAQVPSIKVADVLWMQSRNNFTLLYPDIRGQENTGNSQAGISGGYRIILFKNRLEAYFDCLLRPIAAEILAGRVLNDLDVDSYMSNIIMYRLAHHLGPVFSITSSDNSELEASVALAKNQAQRRNPKNKKEKNKIILKTMPDNLLDLFDMVESLKSQTLALHNTQVLIENGLLPQDKELSVYGAHLLVLLEQIRRLPFQTFAGQPGYTVMNTLPSHLSGQKLAAAVSAIVQLNYLLKREAITFSITSGTIDIEPGKYKEAMKDLAYMALNMCININYAVVRQTFINNLQFEPQLIEILKRLRNIPNFIYYNR